MSFKRFVVGSSLALLVVLFAVGFASAAEDHGKDAGDDHQHVKAEADPGHEEGDGDGAHAAQGDGHGDSHGGDHGGEHHDPYEDALHGNATPQTGPLDGQGNPAEWKSSLAIWTLVVFGCLAAVLWKFAWGPIRDALDSRERSMQQNIDSAREQNEKAAAMLAEHEAKLAGTADEVRQIIDNAKKEAETQKQSILAEAEAAAESQKSRAILEIDAAKNGALQELAEKSVDTAVGLAGKIVQRQLSPEDHSTLISEAIKHFPSKN